MELRIYWKGICKQYFNAWLKSWESQGTDKNKRVLSNNTGEYRILRTRSKWKPDKQQTGLREKKLLLLWENK